MGYLKVKQSKGCQHGKFYCKAKAARLKWFWQKLAKEFSLDEHTILASDDDFGTVSVCPGGVVHINLAHCSLKFVPSDFLKFSELVGKARLNLGQRPQLGDVKPRLQVVPQEPRDSSPSD